MGVEALSGPASFRTEKAKELPRGVWWSELLPGSWILDYICQGNETERKLSNIKLFECILHLLIVVFSHREAEIFCNSAMLTLYAQFMKDLYTRHESI